MMAPLGLCSLIMVTLIIERLIALRRSRIFPVHELERLRAYAEVHEGDLSKLQPTHNNPIGRILLKGLGVIPAPASRFKEAIQDQARHELHYLEKGLVVLEIIVGVAPLLGLLGTALGMIDVFNNLAVEGPGRTEALSGGISEALLTTVCGLAIGIPALIAFNLLSRRVESLALQIEQEVLFFYHKLYPQD